MSVQQQFSKSSAEIYKKISKSVPEIEWKIHAPLIERILNPETQTLISERRAASKGDLAAIRKFRDFVSFRDQRGNTALHYACLFGQHKAVKHLLKCGAAPYPANR